jgi:lipopolysaccharide/colanic/teichoic acid biosynthesis glycosyltransferase
MGERHNDVADAVRGDQRRDRPDDAELRPWDGAGHHIAEAHSLTWMSRRALLVLWDAVGWGVALSLAWALREDFDFSAVAVGPLERMILLAVAAQLVIAVLLQTYRGRNPIGSVDEAINVTGVAVLVGVLVFVSVFSSPELVPRSVPLLAVPIAVLFAVGSRLAVRLYREHHHRADYSRAQRVIIFGAGAEGQQLLRLMRSDPAGSHLPVALLDDNQLLRRYRVSGVAVRGTRADVAEAAVAARADLLVIADRSLPVEVVREIASAAHDAGLAVRMLPAVADLLQPLPADLTVSPHRTASVPSARSATASAGGAGLPAPPVRSRAKRALDVTLAVSSLLVLLPMLALIATALKLSGNEVIYRAPRIGREGRPFTMFKFATMTGDSGPRVTYEGDPRITRAGRWLRATKLNELPQIVNVLKGDMSIVGPRPEDPLYVAQYSARHREVLAVRPGMTSRAFLRFGDEQAFIKSAAPVDVEAYYLQELLPEKLDIELDYVHGWSMWEDLRIVAGTVRRLLA